MKIHIKKKLSVNEQLQMLSDENANFLIQNAMQDMYIQSLQNENSELFLKIATMEVNKNV